MVSEYFSEVQEDTLSAFNEHFNDYPGNTPFDLEYRLKTIRDADQILVVSGGEIIERGDHTSLMDMGGTYARMVSLQAS